MTLRSLGNGPSVIAVDTPTNSDSTQAPPELTARAGRISTEHAAGGPRWRADSEALFSRLAGSMVDVEAALAAVFPKSWRDYTPRPVTLVPWLGRQLCQAYTQPPAVAYRDPDTGELFDEATQKRLLRIRKASGVEKALQAADLMRTTCGNGTVWVLPVLRKTGTGTLAGVRCIAHPVHEQAVKMVDHPESQDERDVEAWWARLPLPGSYLTAYGSVAYGIARITREEAVWETAETLQGQAVWPGGTANPVGEVPAVVLRWDEPLTGEFWSHARHDLLAASQACDTGSTDEGEIARDQGFGQWVGKGITEEQAKLWQFGPRRVVTTNDAAASLENIKQQSDLVGIRGTNEAYMRTVIAANDINPATLLRSTAITAAAKIIELSDRAAQRSTAETELRRAEQRIYDLQRKWLRHLRNGVDVLPYAIVDVTYHRDEIPADPLHVIQAARDRIALGLSSPAQELARMEGLSEVEALRRVRANVAQTLQLLGAMPGQASPMTEPAVPEDDGAGDAPDDKDAAEPKAAPDGAKGSAAKAAAVKAAPVAEVAFNALNGEQIKAVLAIAATVGGGLLTHEAGVAMLHDGLGLAEKTAATILRGAKAPAPAAT